MKKNLNNFPLIIQNNFEVSPFIKNLVEKKIDA